MIITCNIVIGMLSSFLKFRIWCSHVKIGIWFHMWTFLICTCDVFVYDVHIWCSHMMLRYMMFTYDITYEVWYMISHVNLAEDHIRFSHEMYLRLGMTQLTKNIFRAFERKRIMPPARKNASWLLGKTRVVFRGRWICWTRSKSMLQNWLMWRFSAWYRRRHSAATRSINLLPGNRCRNFISR